MKMAKAMPSQRGTKNKIRTCNFISGLNRGNMKKATHSSGNIDG
jgi:hypothetical protein